MLECFQATVVLRVCRVWPILETACGVYSSTNEEKQTDLHMESTQWRDVMHVIVHNRPFQCCSQHLGLVCPDVWVEELSNTAPVDIEGHFMNESHTLSLSCLDT